MHTVFIMYTPEPGEGLQGDPVINAEKPPRALEAGHESGNVGEMPAAGEPRS
jgi:hypothetical protein